VFKYGEKMNIEKIKKIMEEKNITLYRLSKITDLNESNLGKIISGKTKDPRISYVKAIADALEVSIDEIVIRHN
jgi:DNA-binding Xre family transcriptional regulator